MDAVGFVGYHMVEEVVGSGQMKESMMTIMVEEVGPRSGLMAEKKELLSSGNTSWSPTSCPKIPILVANAADSHTHKPEDDQNWKIEEDP